MDHAERPFAPGGVIRATWHGGSETLLSSTVAARAAQIRADADAENARWEAIHGADDHARRERCARATAALAPRRPPTAPLSQLASPKFLPSKGVASWRPYACP